MSSYALTLVSGDVASRSQTDRKLRFLTDGFLLPLITLGIWSFVTLYRLMNRRDRHFAREHALNRDLLQMLKEQVQARGIDPLSLPEMAALEVAARQKEEQELPRSAVLWLILGIATSVTWLFVYFFLSVDFYRHERREADLIEKVNAVLSRVGASTLVPPSTDLPERRYWWNLVLTIVTLGIWGIFWYYHIMADGNRHFEAQWSWEDGLVAQLSVM